MAVPDDMDSVQDRVLAANEAAIASAIKPLVTGLPECKCGEPISQFRQNLGAVRCIGCQTEFERRRR